MDKCVKNATPDSTVCKMADPADTYEDTGPIEDEAEVTVYSALDSLLPHLSCIGLREEEEKRPLENQNDELLSCNANAMEQESNYPLYGDLSTRPVADPNLTLTADKILIMDAQTVFHQGRGWLIKEMAHRPCNGGIPCVTNMIHDVTDVPAHRAVKHDNGNYYDLYTGMNLQAGEHVYSDTVVAGVLNGFPVVIVKGANKKSALSDVYDRLKKAAATDPTTTVYQKPVIINVDGHTADNEDRIFCKENGLSMAAFSFSYVYRNMDVYVKMLYDMPGSVAYDPLDAVFATNVLSKDPRYELSGRGRIACVCHNDHSIGGTVKTFGPRQRCALLNVSILDNMWLRGRDMLFRSLMRGKREGKTRTTGKRDADAMGRERSRHHESRQTCERVRKRAKSNSRRHRRRHEDGCNGRGFEDENERGENVNNHYYYSYYYGGGDVQEQTYPESLGYDGRSVYYRENDNDRGRTERAEYKDRTVHERTRGQHYEDGHYPEDLEDGTNRRTRLDPHDAAREHHRRRRQKTESGMWYDDVESISDYLSIYHPYDRDSVYVARNRGHRAARHEPAYRKSREARRRLRENHLRDDHV